MKNSQKIAAVMLALATSIYTCGRNVSKNIGHSVKIDTANVDSIKTDTVINGDGIKKDTSTKITTSRTTITVDPVTGDSIIISKTVIRHPRKK